LSQDVLPKLTQPVKSDGKKPKGRNGPPPKPAPETEDTAESAAEMTEGVNGGEVVALEFTSGEYNDLCSRFQVESTEALQDALHDCLVGGVAFPLEEEQ